MNKKTLRIAEEILRTAEDLIFADSDYIYDPDHKKHPGGGYHKTEKGWSKVEEKKEKSTSSPKIEMTDEQKKLDEMANSENLFVVIEYVAKNPNASPKTLDKLADGENRDVRFYVAKNPNASPKTLDKLSRYYDEYTRGCVAQNPNTRPETLDKLSNDSESFIKENVAKNPNTSIKTLKKLSNDKKDDVRTIAREKLSQKQWQNSGFDLSKLSPELREKVKEWDIEDIKKFLGWLKEHKG